MAWRLAKSLIVLRTEIRTLHPGTTVWDIGDEEHQESASDHNPNAAGVVCATDTLGDAGLDLAWYAEQVRQAGLRGHPAPKYVIYSRRIASRAGGWAWRPYRGSNPHATHVHVSVGTGPDGQSAGALDDTSPWLLEEEGMPYSNWPASDRRSLAKDVVDEWFRREVPRPWDKADPSQRADLFLGWFRADLVRTRSEVGALRGQVAGLTTLVEQLLTTGPAPIAPEQLAQLLDAVRAAAAAPGEQLVAALAAAGEALASADDTAAV